VVSAMRHTEPAAVNFILTGYPAFETTLEAIRQQVDDYLIKLTEIEFRAASAGKRPRKPGHFRTHVHIFT
jgi:ActR/RegA family two-component response regulator